MTGRIEKTVFISYRRTNFWTALAVFQNLHANGYDVFFDYKSIPSGDFENVITENVKSRAHFLLILSPSALERCNEPGDWLRREIETAIDNQRNIIPLMMEGFDFGSVTSLQALTGKLANLRKYNALSIPAEYFEEAMEKLRSDRFLNRSLESVSHPVSDFTKQITEKQKLAATEAAPVQTEILTAEEWFERGYVFSQAKNFDEALRCYDNSLRLQPDAATYNNVGILLKELGRYDEAEAAYRKAIELVPSIKEAYVNLGALLSDENSKRFDEAEVAYRKAIELSPSDDSAYYGLVKVLGKNINRYDEAEIALHKAIELNPSAAETMLRQAIELNPLDWSAYYSLGVLFGETKRYEEAETAYRKAIELDPSNELAYHQLGNLLKDLNRFDEAIPFLSEAIRLKPDVPEAYYNRCIAYIITHDNGSALADAESAIHLNPNSSEYYSLRAAIRGMGSDWNGAIEDMGEAIRLQPDDVQGYIFRATLLSIVGNMQAATKDYDEAIRHNPKHANAYYHRASLWEQKKSYSRAISDYQKYLELSDENQENSRSEIKKKIRILKNKLAKKKSAKKTK